MPNTSPNQDVSFTDLGLSARVLARLGQLKFTTPTPIQLKAIPIAIKGGDVIGIAQTGTGKTLAFALPLIEQISRTKKSALVIVPTRELAMQVNEAFIAVGQALGLRCAVLIGGASMQQQIQSINRRPHVYVGTPGRLLDHLDSKTLQLKNIGILVLDEADRMLDMGFVNDMRFIMGLMPEKHQTLFFSATVNREIDKLVQEFLNRPVTISVKTGSTSKNVDQDVIRVRHEGEKLSVLQEILSQPEFSKVLIFGRTKFGVEKLSIALTRGGFKADAIHGNKNQNKRQLALKLFKENKTTILVATDVAARGLDIPNVTHVINYDIPATYDDYCHRIGRTGRADQTGKALTFIS